MIRRYGLYSSRSRDAWYRTLETILEKHLVKNMSVEDISACGFESGLVRSVIAMVEKAEYKRRQAPPVLKVSPKAFGTGR